MTPIVKGLNCQIPTETIRPKPTPNGWHTYVTPPPPSVVDIGGMKVQVLKQESIFLAYPREPIYLTPAPEKDYLKMRLIEITRSYNYDQDIDLMEALQILKVRDPNFQDAFGRTPLHYALIYRKGGLIKLFRYFKASYRIKDNEGVTPAQLLYDLSLKPPMFCNHS